MPSVDDSPLFNGPSQEESATLDFLKADKFSSSDLNPSSESEPLAYAMRPKILEEFVGQQHLLAEGKPLRAVLESGQLHSMIFWGPPGVGKTTLAKLIAKATDAQFIQIQAVMAGVKDIRTALARAEQEAQLGRKTLVFIDEVHRFNKAQQDAFLPFVEAGTFVFMGATTENPSFEINRALLSRAIIYPLYPLSETELSSIVERALNQEVGKRLPEHMKLTTEAMQALCRLADGDARRLLNALEQLGHQLFHFGHQEVDLALLQRALKETTPAFDKQGDQFYELISALHKAVRGSSVDGALYWFARMLEGGCDPLYIARRVVRMASEDIGNADPRALTIALNAWDVQRRLGSPEGELSIAQAIAYMAVAPKSNAVYLAFKKAQALVSAHPSYQVPMHLRNAPTPAMKELGYAKGYRYAHDEPEAYAAGECYLPEPLQNERVYDPVPRGLEAKIQQKLHWLNSLDEKSQTQRYQNSEKEGEQ